LRHTARPRPARPASRAVARESGRNGITANNVSLGTIAAEGLPDAPDNPMLKRYVIRRFGLPSDVAPMVTFLASEHSAWVTGQTIAVNGGYSFAL
jgi:2-hydroxycyclohexanecarboxyl-CoA dehydrogenase